MNDQDNNHVPEIKRYWNSKKKKKNKNRLEYLPIETSKALEPNANTTGRANWTGRERL